MRNLKKFLALVLAMMMVFSLMVTVNAATVSVSDYQSAYSQLARYGVFQGGTNGKEDITGEYTRAQMSTVVYRLMTGDITGDGAIPYADYAAERFDDVKATDWFAPYVGWAANANVVIGYPNGNFGPNDNVTGFQTALMLLRTLGRDYYKEYTNAKDWQLEVGRDSRQLGILQNADIGQLTGDASRGLAAYLVSNAVKYPYIVVHSGNGTYESTGKKLISVNSIEESTDDWGVEGTKTNYSFNWPDQPVPGSYFDEVTPLAVYYGPVTQCDVSEKTGLDGVTLTTYTNGVKNKGNQLIEDTNTTALLGAQGRETRVYEDRIVYRDTVLVEAGVPTNIADSVGHTYQTTATTANIYANTGMNGKAGGVKPLLAPQTTSWSDSYELAGTYTPLSLLTANVLTWTTGNTLNSEAGSNTSPKTYAWQRLQNVKDVSSVDVTVEAIRRGSDGTTITGFRANGTEYLYGVSYYGDISTNIPANQLSNANTTYGSTTQVLNTEAIGKTYTVYYYTVTDSDYVVATDDNGTRNIVLGIGVGTTSEDYGVVIGQKVVQVSNPNSLTNTYAIEYTIMLKDYTTITRLSIGKNQSTPFAVSSLPAGDNDLYRHLVKISVNPNNKNYWNVEPAVDDLGTQYNVFYVGDADTIKTNQILVNDDTVFFVANYTMTNSSQNPIAYSTNGGSTSGYTVYEGFKTLPNDLSFAVNNASNKKIYENGEEVKGYTTGNNNVPISNLDVYAFANGAPVTGSDYVTADYVLILNATDLTPIAKRAQPVQNYAYVLYDSQASYIYDTYYRFNVLLKGNRSTLDITGTSGSTVSTSGLYIYEPVAGNGTNANNAFEPVNGNAAVVNHVTNKGWEYDYAGVLKVTPPVTPNNTTATLANIGWNNTYYTVVDNVPIYIVNEANNTYRATSYDLNTLKLLYDEMYFQVNAYGWIDFIYMVDKSNAPTTTPLPTSTSITYTAPSALDSVPFTVNGVSAIFSSPTNGSITGVSGWKYIKNDGTTWTAATTDTVFQSGYTYEVTLTLSGVNLTSAPTISGTTVVDYTSSTVTVRFAIS